MVAYARGHKYRHDGGRDLDGGLLLLISKRIAWIVIHARRDLKGILQFSQ